MFLLRCDRMFQIKNQIPYKSNVQADQTMEFKTIAINWKDLTLGSLTLFKSVDDTGVKSLQKPFGDNPIFEHKTDVGLAYYGYGTFFLIWFSHQPRKRERIFGNINSFPIHMGKCIIKQDSCQIDCIWNN